MNPTKNLLRRHGDTGLAAVIGVFCIYLYTRHSGVGISPDSITYGSTALNFAHSGIFIDFNRNPVVDFPVFYPWLLGVLARWTQVSPFVFGADLNMALFASLLLMDGWMMEHFSVRSKAYKWAMLSILILSPCLLEVYAMLWSETLFGIWILLYLLAYARYQNSRTWSALCILGLITALACITRYAAATLILTTGVLFVLDASMTWGQKIRHGLVYGVVSISLLALNLYRNLQVRFEATGPREKGITSLWTNLSYTGQVIHDWFIPWTWKNTSLPWTSVALLLSLGVLFIRHWTARKSYSSFELGAITFTLVYTVFIVVIATLSRFEAIDSRLLSPMFVTGLWALTSWIPGYSLKLNSRRGKRMVALSCLMVFLVAQSGQVMADYANYDGIKDAGMPGYAEDSWTQSSMIAYFKHHKEVLKQAGIAYYSDGNDALYYFLDIHAHLLPHKDSKDEVSIFLKEPHVYVLWFYDDEDSDLISQPFIQQHKYTRVLGKWEEGLWLECSNQPFAHPDSLLTPPVPKPSDSNP